MSENLEDNEPRIIPPAVGNTQNEHVEPLIGTEHAPRVARSVSSDPEESALPSSGAATPVRPAPRRSAPRARRMSLSLTRVDAWSVAKVTFMLSIAVAIIQVVASAIVWVLLDVVGVFSQITQIVSSTGLDAGGLRRHHLLDCRSGDLHSAGHHCGTDLQRGQLSGRRCARYARRRLI